MANQILTNVARYPNATEVKAYPASNWPNGIVNESAAPVGTAADTQTMTSGTLTFTGLTAGVSYVAHASVGGQHRYSSFIAGADLSTLDGVTLDPDDTLAADSDERVATQQATKAYVDGQVGGSGIPATTVDAKGDLIAATAADAVDNLPVGTNGQFLTAQSGQAMGLQWASLDAELTAIAGLTSAADKGIQFTGAGTAATYDLTAAGKALLDDADASAQLTTLGVSAFVKTILDDADAAAVRTTIGAQASDAELAALAGLTSAADRIPYFTGSGTADLIPTTSYARTFLSSSVLAGALSNLGFSTDMQSFLATANDAAANTALGSIPATLVDAKGDVLTATAADTPARLAAGTNEQSLVADSAQASGLKYAFRPRVLASSGAQIADKGNVTTEETFVTVAVPANAMGVNGILKVWVTWAYTASTNTKTLRVKLGTTAYANPVLSGASQVAAHLCVLIQNRNSATAQIGNTLGSVTGGVNSASTTGTEDTTGALNVVITGQKATGTETLTLERYWIEILPAS